LRNLSKQEHELSGCRRPRLSQVHRRHQRLQNEDGAETPGRRWRYRVDRRGRLPKDARTSDLCRVKSPGGHSACTLRPFQPMTDHEGPAGRGAREPLPCVTLLHGSCRPAAVVTDVDCCPFAASATARLGKSKPSRQSGRTTVSLSSRTRSWVIHAVAGGSATAPCGSPRRLARRPAPAPVMPARWPSSGRLPLGQLVAAQSCGSPAASRCLASLHQCAAGRCLHPYHSMEIHGAL
jgi:hypothetical protein